MQRCKTVEACSGLVVSQERLLEMSRLLLVSLEEGLSKEKHQTAAVRCYQTYVQDFPSGNESGTFLALDLGGTNFRVLSVTLSGTEQAKMTIETYAFPEKKKKGTGSELFDHVADCVLHFCKKHNINIAASAKLPMGFTFSFPTKQTGLNKGILIKWTKGFLASGVEGEDVVKLLNEAFARKNLPGALLPIAILNDTTGTLMACAIDHRDCRVGLICGTGNNACYTERIENIKNFNGDPSKPFMIINTEWGNFGADGKLQSYLTEFDITLIEASVHKYNQTFEKCVSGMYLGEIMRLILLKLIKDGVMFGGTSSKTLDTRRTFETKFLTDIETDPKDGPYRKTEAVLTQLGIKKYDQQDLIDMRYIASVVSTRAASFIGAAVATLLNKMEISTVTVAVDGSVYRYHPTFAEKLYEVTRSITKDNIEYVLADDGSGKGAAFVAAVTATAEEKI